MAQRIREPPHCSVQTETHLTSQIKRWTEHINSVLNRPSGINRQTSTDRMQCSVRMNFRPSWKQEKQFNNCHLTKLQMQMRFLPRSIRLGLLMAEKLTKLFHCMWRIEAIPQEFKDASIIHLYKRKGNPQVCDNNRGISLPSIAGKILTKFC